MLPCLFVRQWMTVDRRAVDSRDQITGRSIAVLAILLGLGPSCPNAALAIFTIVVWTSKEIHLESPNASMTNGRAIARRRPRSKASVGRHPWALIVHG
jgi:hypothetical protein